MSPTNERDAGFCSGSSENEEDLDHHHQMRLINSSSECSNSSQSAQSSEDSSVLGESKFLLPVTPVTITTTTATKNKRKSSEPIRVVSELSQCAPIKKRIKLENEKMLAKAQAEQQLMMMTTAAPLLSPDPFRPWTSMIEDQTKTISPAHSFKRHPGVTTLHRVPGLDSADFLPKFMMPVQEEPIALLVTKKKAPTEEMEKDKNETARNLFSRNVNHNHNRMTEEPRPAHLNNSRAPSLIDDTSSTASSFVSPTAQQALKLSMKVSQATALPPPPAPASLCPSEGSSAAGEKKSGSKDCTQRNYKNMTRERRIEANARERTRVHTISAAFEKLRSSVPAYSNTQKLSKLSVLRIACSYIMSLSRIADMDYSEDQSAPPIGDCVDALTRTIQTEGKLRKKKDE